MEMQPPYTRAMVGYALWIVIEDTLRNWLSTRLSENFGSDWPTQIPAGIWNRLQERYDENIKPEKLSQIRDLLEHSDFPDIFDIIRYRKMTGAFLPEELPNDIDYYSKKLYDLRNQIAHKPYGFNVRQLDDLVGSAEWVLKFVGPLGADLNRIKIGINERPQDFAREIPEEFIRVARADTAYRITNNLPAMDYEYDGGFVGRRDERRDLKRKLLDKRIHPILTVSGAGGVGKTALAHHVCDEILKTEPEAFEGLVWLSAKKDRLTLTGIEEVEPSARSFEEVLDTILETFGFGEYTQDDLSRKAELISEIIFDGTSSGILLVIDNLETILHDEELIEYIKDIPLPHKVLITSRLGLGEIERRVQINQMSTGDAIELFRRIAREKSSKNLAQLPSEVIEAYIERMSGYPLVIKWVVSQAAAGKDIERLVQTINSTDSDISQFCFEYIYDKLLTDKSKLVLQCLAASEQELTQAALMHVAELDLQSFEDVMRELELASLVIPNQTYDSSQEKIITRYSILPLTKAYLTSKDDAGQAIRNRLQNVQNIVEEARRAKKQYELSLEYLGAETDEELIASKYIQTALTRNQAGDYTGAVEALEKARQTVPDFAGVYRSWAVVERDNEKYDDALELFERAAILKPNDATTWFYWADLEKKLLNYESARKYLNKALALVEDKASVLIALGNVEKQDSNFQKAIELFEQAILEFKQSTTAITERPVIVAFTSMADTYRRWAEVYAQDGQLFIAIDKAKLAYQIVLKTREYGSYDTKTSETQLKAALLLGKLYDRVGDSTSAMQYLDQIINIDLKTWTWSQRRQFTRACFTAVPLLIDGGQLVRAREVYELGRSRMATNDTFKEKYEALELLFDQRFRGVFVHVVADKGYGFIKAEGIPEGSVFAHISDFVDEIGDDFSVVRDVWVAFSLKETGDKRPSAKAIRILK